MAREIQRVRVRFEEIVRKATMELLAQDDENGEKEQEREELEKYRWDDATWGNVAWKTVAPFVDGVLNLMKKTESFSDANSRLESVGAPNTEPILIIMKMAEKFGFGYRQGIKDWDQFQALVPAIGGLLKDTNSRDLMRHSLSKVGPLELFDFRGVSTKEIQFTRDKFEESDGDESPKDPQSVYEEAIPGELPQLESRNIRNILDLYAGEAELDKKVGKALSDWAIIDYSTGKFNTDRLQSVLRYAMEKPDAPEAVAVVVGALVREAVRRGEFEDGVARLVSPDELLSGMQSATDDLLQRWLSMAMSILALVGRVPRSENYGSIKKVMAQNAASIAIDIGKKLLGAMLRSSQDQLQAEKTAVSDVELAAKTLWREAEREGNIDIGQHVGMFSEWIARMGAAVQDDDAAALRQAASGLSELVREVIQPVLGSEAVGKFSEAVEKLLSVASPARAAAKRIANSCVGGARPRAGR